MCKKIVSLPSSTTYQLWMHFHSVARSILKCSICSIYTLLAVSTTISQCPLQAYGIICKYGNTIKNRNSREQD
ncbi:hypothetical protein XELAEV_18030928mg [Xenopus laevis]|uniref:Uncharacterized protein n=1 Tax=Xenopus laevis TaxID=8355 RepID=A0A974CN65_XENLA|nr:hypothetical protein XELAEV_18030928mg [Xenopus laevis]